MSLSLRFRRSITSQNYNYSKLFTHDTKYTIERSKTTNIFYLDICFLDGYCQHKLISHNIMSLIINYWEGLLSNSNTIILHLHNILHDDFFESLCNQIIPLDKFITFHCSSDSFKQTQKTLSNYNKKFIKKKIKIDINTSDSTIIFMNTNTKPLIQYWSEQQQFFYYCKTAQISKMKQLFGKSNHNIDINEWDHYNRTQNTALHYAVQSGSLDAVNTVFDLECRLDAKNRWKCTPLHIAASKGFTDIVQFLIDMKSYIEATNIIYNTPLHCAVYAGHVDVTKALLDTYDDPTEALMKRNGVGCTVIDYAAHPNMIDYLKQFVPQNIYESNIEEEML